MTNKRADATRRSSLGRPGPALPDAGALEFFARVAAAESFAAAARELGQTRAAVSRRVAQIELQLGTPLFARHTRAVGLTEAGRRLLARARFVLEAAEAARRALRTRASGLAGTLRVTTVPVFGQTVLGPLLAAFQARHPELQVELRFTARRVDLLREDIDLAFRITERPPEDCIAQPVLRFAVGAYAAPGFKPRLRHPQDLARARCLVFGTAAEAQTLHWQHEASGERAAVELRPCMSADDLGTLQAAARAGGGVVFTPDFAVRDDLARGTLVNVLPGWRLPIPEGDTVQALTLPLAVAPEAARALVRFVRDAQNGIDTFNDAA